MFVPSTSRGVEQAQSATRQAGHAKLARGLANDSVRRRIVASCSSHGTTTGSRRKGAPFALHVGVGERSAPSRGTTTGSPRKGAPVALHVGVGE
jgi:hypothetical protein